MTHGGATWVAPQLTVVWFARNENGGPGILPLGTFPNATRRTQAWTPQQHSAPMWHAPPEDKPARVTLASTRARTSAFSAQRVRGCLETKPLYEKTLGHMRGEAKNGLTG